MSESFIQLPPDNVGKKARALKRTVNDVEVYERVVALVDPSTGNVIDPRQIIFQKSSLPTYSVAVAGSSVAANKHHLVIFNGSGSGIIIEILRVVISAETTSTVTGYTMGYRLNRTTSAGSGGTAITPNKMHSGNPDLPTQVIIWTNPTTAPTITQTVAVGSINPEETGGGNSMILYEAKPDEQPLTLLQGEGITVQQYGTAGVGLFNCYIVFRVRTT